MWRRILFLLFILTSFTSSAQEVEETIGHWLVVTSTREEAGKLVTEVVAMDQDSYGQTMLILQCKNNQFSVKYYLPEQFYFSENAQQSIFMQDNLGNLIVDNWRLGDDRNYVSAERADSLSQTLLNAEKLSLSYQLADGNAYGSEINLDGYQQAYKKTIANCHK